MTTKCPASDAKSVLERAGYTVSAISKTTLNARFPYVTVEPYAFAVFDGTGFRQEDLRISAGWVCAAEITKLLEAVRQ